MRVAACGGGSDWIVIGNVEYAVFLPRVAGEVYHGGAGTAMAASPVVRAQEILPHGYGTPPSAMERSLDGGKYCGILDRAAPVLHAPFH